MAVCFAGVEPVDAALVDFGYEGGVNASFLKLTYYIICAVVAESVVDFAGSGPAVSGTGYTDLKTIFLHHAGDFIAFQAL